MHKSNKLCMLNTLNTPKTLSKANYITHVSNWNKKATKKFERKTILSKLWEKDSQ